MANALFLLQPNFSFNSLLHQTFNFPLLNSPQITFSSGCNDAFKLNYTRYKLIGGLGYPKLRIKCFYNLSPNPKGENAIGAESAVGVGPTVVVKPAKGENGTGVDSALGAGPTVGVKAALGAGPTVGVMAAEGENGIGVGPTVGGGENGIGVESAVGVGPTVGVKRPSVAGKEIFLTIFLGLGVVCLIGKYIPEETSVLKLQVGLSGTGRLLQKDLNWIAGTANTYTPEGLSYVLQETTLALLRRPEYCISGYSSVYMKRSIQKVENIFNQLSVEERGKFDVKTLVNINYIGQKCVTTQRSKNFQNDYNVVTMIVAAGGRHKLPLMNSSANLKEALIKIATIPPSKVKAVAVYVTPQSENYTLTEQKFLEEYPLLRLL